MSEINQIAVSRLLQAMSTSRSLNSNNNSSSDGLYDFVSILENSFASSNNLGNSCTSCSNTENSLNFKSNLNLNSLDELMTLLGNINANRINVNINYVKPEDIQIDETNTRGSLEKTIGNNERIENAKDTVSKTKMDKAIELLEGQLGKKYVWGATGPNSFDCSGLTQYIYKEALNKDIPRVSYDQSKYGKYVNKKDLQVGDLLFFDTMSKGRVSHVGMYIGNNEFIHASNPRDGVKKSTLSGYYEKHYMGARRPLVK